ncbi:CU044_2847 family protein [Streptomyces sp. DT2A-34]|uniref:CU044_2847 family protein n=1 Tax=Streptomyces sp. DT2A-34 TaxID=3051182 RepID=UPI00265C13B2|nr:CU044_2847 family protein [Streptomyces sp. DT2A-34]MDO0911828.1 CU044_2847 family protein [Streptomyces sp. DT2A-34]
MERRIQEIELPGGQTVLARVGILRADDLPGDEEEFAYDDVGALDQLSARVEQLNELVTGVGGAVLAAGRAAGPDEISATFGVELAAKPGKAVALLADGEAKAAISVTLTWHLDGRGTQRTGDGTASGEGTGAGGA